jgi:hypothetical protein
MRCPLLLLHLLSVQMLMRCPLFFPLLVPSLLQLIPTPLQVLVAAGAAVATTMMFRA